MTIHVILSKFQGMSGAIKGHKRSLDICRITHANIHQVATL